MVPASPTPFTPSEFTGDGVTVDAEFVVRQHVGLGHGVVHEARGDELAVFVVDHFLVHRLRDSLRDAAVNLALDQQRAEDFAAIVDRDVSQKFRLTGLRIDFDDRDVGAEREGARRGS